jgi:hypothetical protein
MHPSLDNLKDPEFLQYLRKRFPGKIEPEQQDFDFDAHAETDAECAHQYRLAQAGRIIRLWKEWKAASPRPRSQKGK